MIYLSTLAYGVVEDSLHMYAIWLAVTTVYILERAITVAKRGFKQVLLAASLIIEMPYDICLQAVHSYAIATALLRTRKSW